MKALSVLVGILCISDSFAATFYRCFWVNDDSVDCGRFQQDVTCGTNLVTYQNKCEFSKAHCADNTIDLLHYGPCNDADKPTDSPVAGGDVVFDFLCTSLSHMDCPPDDSQVCATDGRTYDSYCEYEKAKCTHRDLDIVNYGPCTTA